MSDNDMNDQRPNEPVQPTSGQPSGPDAGHGWRPPSAGSTQPVDQPGAGSTQPTGATPGPGAGGGAPAGPVAPAGQPAPDDTTTPQPYGGAPWPPQTYGSGQAHGAGQYGAGQPQGAGQGSGPGQPQGAGESQGAGQSGGADDASRAGEQPGAQPGPYQPGSYPVGGYPTSQYQQPGTAGGYYPGQTTGAGYQGGSGGGYQGGYQGGYHPIYQQPGPTRERSRTRLGVAAGVLGVLLALGGGVAGAAIMHGFDGNNGTTVATSGPGSAPDNAPIIDRSSLASIAAAVRPSVVSITTSNATGSGVVISKDGYILTNNHVAATASGKNVQITLSDGSSVQGKLIGTDPKTDLAVFKAQNLTKELTAAKFGDSNALRVGDTVLAIGSPLGLDGSVTSGIVSALNRTIDESSDSQPQNPFGQQGQSSSPGATIAGAIQTDAPINPGNSGGALVNTSGEVVGINTAIATNGADGNIGVGFAIPSNKAKTVSDDIIRGVAVQHPFLGVSVGTADGNAGAQVQSVQSGSPAANAGIKAGDLITAFDNKAVHTSDDLVNDVQAGNVNDKVTLTVQRGGSATQITVTLGESK